MNKTIAEDQNFITKYLLLKHSSIKIYFTLKNILTYKRYSLESRLIESVSNNQQGRRANFAYRICTEIA